MANGIAKIHDQLGFATQIYKMRYSFINNIIITLTGSQILTDLSPALKNISKDIKLCYKVKHHTKLAIII